MVAIDPLTLSKTHFLSTFVTVDPESTSALTYPPSVDL
jgi:hypothetical protein